MRTEIRGGHFGIATATFQGDEQNSIGLEQVVVAWISQSSSVQAAILWYELPVGLELLGTGRVDPGIIGLTWRWVGNIGEIDLYFIIVA